MISRYLGWYRPWRQLPLITSYKLRSEGQPPLLSNDDQQITHNVEFESESLRQRVLDVPPESKLRLSDDARLLHKDDPRQSHNESRDLSHAMAKRACDGQRRESGAVIFHDLELGNKNDRAASNDGPWSIEAVDGDHNQLQGLKLVDEQACQHIAALKDHMLISFQSEQRPVKSKDIELKVSNEEDRADRLVVRGVGSALQRNREDLRTMEDRKNDQGKAFTVSQRSDAATAGTRAGSRKKEMFPHETVSKEHRHVGARTQTGSVAPQQGLDFTSKEAEGRPKQPSLSFASLSREAREKWVAEMAAQQNAAQAALDRKYEKFQRTYVEPWELFRETRQSAAEEMVRAAKAEAIQRAAKTTSLQEPKAGSNSAEERRNEVQVEAVTVKALGKSTEDTKGSKAIGSNIESDAVTTGLAQAEKKHVVAARPTRILKIDMEPVQQSTEQARPGSDVSTKQTEAEEIAMLFARIGLTNRPAVTRSKAAPKLVSEAKRPSVDGTKREPSPLEEPPKRQRKGLNPALDPDSLLVRYAELESNKVPELDRDESRRIFKDKQAQLRKKRARNWWEKDEDAVQEDLWQLFTRERHPGAEASSEELHLHYRMLHDTVPLPRRQNQLDKYTNLRYNKKRTPAMPVLEEKSEAKISAHQTTSSRDVVPPAGASVNKKPVKRPRPSKKTKSSIEPGGDRSLIVH